MFNRFTIYRQLDSMDCGPACLKMIFKHYGKHIDLNEIKKVCQIGSTGVSLLGLSDAAEKYGFRTVSAKLTFEQLFSEAPLPCVLLWEQKHFVVLTPSSSKKKIKIADPSRGLVKYKRDEFLDHWLSSKENGQNSGIAFLLTPGSSFYKLENDREESLSWKHLFKYLTKFKHQLFQLFLGLILGSVFQLIFPFLTQSIVDVGIKDQNLNFIQLILIAQFALFFGQTIVEFIRSRVLLFISTHINLSIVSDFWMKLFKLPLSFFDIRNTGDIFQRVMDHRRIEQFITGTAIQTLFSVFTFVIFSIVLLIYNTTIFAFFLAGSILYIIWISFLLKYRRALDYKHFAAASKENSATMQMIGGMHEIKLNNAEQIKRWEWEKLRALLFKLNFKSLSLTQIQQIGGFFINQSKNIFITFLVAKAVIDGELTLGAMLAIQYIIGQLNSPVEQLINFSQQAQDAKISLERLNEIHQLEDEEPKNKVFSTNISDIANIEFKDLNFAYNGTNNASVLKNIKTIIPHGKTTAIVGSSGSGKTTILKLIQKFYTNYEGEIKVGGTDLKYLSSKYWRSISGSVMQEGYIFSDTIERNIAIGDISTNFDKLKYACKVANILEFVESLPLGFSTKIGTEGTGISSGQKQRILIARIIYKNPRFIFFDEATNALDANNERVIIENLHEFFSGKTVVIAAHRLSTIKNADKILVLDQGEIVEDGNHLDLVEKKGRYFELVKNQLELEA